MKQTQTPPEPLQTAPISPDQSASTDAAALAISVRVADVGRKPDAGSELVTQALLGTPAQIIAEADGWVQVKLPDYDGWIRRKELAAPTKLRGQVAVVTTLQTPLYLDAIGGQADDTAYVTTTLPVAQPKATNGRICVALPGGARRWLDSSAVAIHSAKIKSPRGTVNDALALARRMLGVPYLWGGTTPGGTDCSGLVQMCWRHAGITIRRDADQQYESIPYVVARGELRAGDLAFFARDGCIVHVGIMLDGTHMLHADGTVRHQVTINGLTPDTEDYSPRLDALYAGARRPLPTVLGKDT